MLKKIKGTQKDDVLIGAKADEYILGLGGNDRLFGQSGADKLDGGRGNDLLDGGTGIDWMLGGLGDDSYKVGHGADKITENDGAGTDSVWASVSYTLSAFVENLTLGGGAGLTGKGNDQANVIHGNSGANKLYAEATVNNAIGGPDALYGLGGNDTLYSGDGDCTLDGGDGADIAAYSLLATSVTVTVDSASPGAVVKSAGGADSLVDIESVRGSAAGDVFEISKTGNYYGGLGNDTMSDHIDDGIFATFFGEDGDDTLSTGADGGVLDGGAGNDILSVGASASLDKIRLTGGAGSDQFWLAIDTTAPNGAIAAGVKIMDFEDGVDHLVLPSFGAVTTADDWFALLTDTTADPLPYQIEDTVDGIEIGSDLGTGTVVILGFHLADFSAADILVL